MLALSRPLYGDWDALWESAMSREGKKTEEKFLKNNSAMLNLRTVYCCHRSLKVLVVLLPWSRLHCGVKRGIVS